MHPGSVNVQAAIWPMFSSLLSNKQTNKGTKKPPEKPQRWLVTDTGIWRLIFNSAVKGDTSDPIVPTLLTGVFPNLSVGFVCVLKRKPTVKSFLPVYSTEPESF